MTTSKGSIVTRAEFIVSVLLLAVFAVFMLRWGIEGAIHNRPVQIVPDLKSRSISGALDMLAPLKLSLLKDGSEFNSSVPIGSILRQRPPAGTKVREGKSIRVVVSQGGETVFTPAISGLPLRNAEMLLRQNQLILGEVTESPSLRLEKGLILSQDPQAETSVERNSLVNVVVSRGEPPEGVVLMPDFLRKNLAEASQWATEKGVPLTIDKDASSLFPYGTILAQDPQSDSLVADDTQVKFTISGRPREAKDTAAVVNFQYKVPQGSSESLVRVLMVDQHGERELFNGLRQPGTKVDLSIPEAGQARIKIFLNGILVEERDL
jgi:serine/threonine-protein kinase